MVVKNGDNIMLRIGNDEKVIDNVVVDIDIVVFKKVYKYDVVVVYYMWYGSIMGYYEYEFDF